VKSWKVTSIAITPIESAKTIAITMAVKIFGVADGLRPKAVMLAKALAIKTAMGPKMHKLKIMTRAAFLDMICTSSVVRRQSSVVSQDGFADD
jgi:hypothetical protein